MRNKPQYAKIRDLGSDSDELTLDDVEATSPVDTDEMNVEISLLDWTFLGKKYHVPLLDIDFHAELIPSSTPDHFHLKLDRALTHAEYDKLLSVLVEVGIVEQGNYERFKVNGFTAVRKPGVKKEFKK